mmetsp:Transcript_48371/g.108678  ORF Transcript_48371/g.108678 Transcript_48371/m.108678 type:complete len:142 (-) Transcript_48371:497-922(-)
MSLKSAPTLTGSAAPMLVGSTPAAPSLVGLVGVVGSTLEAPMLMGITGATLDLLFSAVSGFVEPDDELPVLTDTVTSFEGSGPRPPRISRMLPDSPAPGGHVAGRALAPDSMASAAFLLAFLSNKTIWPRTSAKPAFDFVL